MLRYILCDTRMYPITKRLTYWINISRADDNFYLERVSKYSDYYYLYAYNNNINLGKNYRWKEVTL